MFKMALLAFFLSVWRGFNFHAIFKKYGSNYGCGFGCGFAFKIVLNGAFKES